MQMEQNVAQIINRYCNHPILNELLERIGCGERNVYIKGVAGSSFGFILAAATKKIGRVHLVIMNSKDDAAYLFSDLSQFADAKTLFYFPSSYKRSLQHGQTSAEAIIQRTDVLNLARSLVDEPNLESIVITYPDALVEKVVSLDTLSRSSFTLKKGEAVSQGFILEALEEYGFERVEFVFEPGQYSVRGGIVDVFSYSSAEPYRIDFFGDTVDTIRTFDVEDQLSREIMDTIAIIPNVQQDAGCKVPLTQLLPDSAVVWYEDVELTIARMNRLNAEWQSVCASGECEPPFATADAMLETLTNKVVVELGTRQYFAGAKTVEFSTVPQPTFNKNFELLADDILRRDAEGYTTYIVAENPNQQARLTKILDAIHPEIRFVELAGVISRGFIDHTLRCCFYTDHQLFDRYHRYKLKHEFSRKDAISARELVNLQKGDYVVHIDHGIGVFSGLLTTEVSGRKQEVVRITYKDDDTLLVSIHNLHKISKYRGKDSESPVVHRLGSGAWQRLKTSTKSKIKDIAKELIALYAKRKEIRGFAFSPDTYLQHELEASFLFEDTPDQVTATQSVKDDMEDIKPMDRLICGDVGFGKTEIAVRAAFKAVADSKQVAVLVPTTILALQHYQTFSRRLQGMPCTVEFINRMKSVKEQNEIKKKIEQGSVDIVIGTHAILGKNINFKDLGLIIIDEEQKFGVGAKEKLKQFKTSVDTLTLTATPIPRTLQFSLMGARDLSIINTPPPNRHPIFTELHEFSARIVKDAVEHEVKRGGQVFFVHNRVQNIGDVEAMIHRECPRIKTGVAHGQMDPKQLEKVMLSFINGDFDVLISTSIVESGLDIPNANTIIVNNAHSFGLSDLHQLRGRVGRSNRKAYCYLLAPPLENLTNDARRRLKAIAEFSELGSGFSIAMQDLDIRGAGNILGGEQSGFIADIGFETYQQILDEALEELKLAEMNASSGQAPTVWKPEKAECYVETDMELLIPDTYVASIAERIRLYRVIDAIKTEEQLQKFKAELSDRFGDIPPQTLELLSVVKLRWLALNLGFERIMMRNGSMMAHFISNKLSPFYRTDTFAQIMGYIAQNPARFTMKESKGKLTLSVIGVDSINEALRLLLHIKESVLGKNS